MSTTTTRPSAAQNTTDAFLSELISALPVVILYRAIRASRKPRAELSGSMLTAASH